MTADIPLVDLASFISRKNLALDYLIVDPHREIVDDRTLRKREDVRAFDGHAFVILERLIDLRHSDLILNCHVDVMIADRQPGFGVWGWPRNWRVNDDEAVGCDGGRCA